MAMGLLNFLPDDPAKKEAARQGLLSLGAAMLQGRGNFGQVVGQGLGAGVQGYQGGLEAQQKAQMDQAQLRMMQAKEQRASALNDTISRAFSGQGTGSAPVQTGASTGGPISGGVVSQGGAPPNTKFPLTLNQLSAIKAMGGPDLSGEYKMANEGFERKQGSTYVNPDGTRETYARLGDGQTQAADGSVSNAAGYVNSVADIERAKADAQEGARANYDLVDPTKFVGADGSPILSTRAGLISKIGQLPQKGQPRQASTASPAGFPVVTPQQQKSRDGTRLEILRNELANTTDPRDREALQREIAGAGGGGGALQSPIQARQQQGAVDTTIQAGQKLNDNWITQVQNPVQSDGKAAKSTLSQIETIKNIGLKTGWGTETKAAAASVLGAMGVQNAEKYAGNAQMFQQVAMERNMTMLQAQSGPQTEGDSQRAQQTFLKLANTPAANAFIADLTAANARNAVKKAEYYNKALPLARQMGDMTEIDRRWSKIAPSVWDDPQLAKYKAVK